MQLKVIKLMHVIKILLDKTVTFSSSWVLRSKGATYMGSVISYGRNPLAPASCVLVSHASSSPALAHCMQASMPSW